MESNDRYFLHQYFLNNSTKRLHKWVHYFDIYERHFSRFRNRQPVVLEIGVMGGGSLQMWSEYFGPGAQIIGLDIDPACAQHRGKGIDVLIGDQKSPELAEDIRNRYGELSIVIDDGSHVMGDVIASFDLYYKAVTANGVYMVEDMHTAYWPKFDGGLLKKDTFIELSKSLIDRLNAVHIPELPVDEFTRSTDSISFYDSVVVFEKRPQGHRQAPVTNPMALRDPR